MTFRVLAALFTLTAALVPAHASPGPDAFPDTPKGVVAPVSSYGPEVPLAY